MAFFGFVLVVFFHVFTKILFPIGMFPYVMIVSSLIFFDPKLHHKIIDLIPAAIKVFKFKVKTIKPIAVHVKNKIGLWIVGSILVLQLLIPFRYLLYWRTLLDRRRVSFFMACYAHRKMGLPIQINCYTTQIKRYINNSDFLTSFQEKQMSFQADMILEYAHFLGEHYRKEGYKNFGIYAEAYNNFERKKKVNHILTPQLNLLDIDESFKHKYWIQSFKGSIRGFLIGSLSCALAI